MNELATIRAALKDGAYRQKLEELYIDKKVADKQTERYLHALTCFEQEFGDGPAEIYSAPGRTEIGGNHTDHQHGNVLAASIHQDAIAVVRPTSEPVIRFLSQGYEVEQISLSDTAVNEKEYNTTTALVKGVVAGFLNHSLNVGGFDAYITSDVLIGAGLSSSAAFETLVGTILSGLYNNAEVSAVDIAKIGQYAENVYFGKPCGLMDQMACSVGNLVHIDFADPKEPIVERIEFDLSETGYCLCVTDTKGSHANLTPDYAAIPAEMKLAANALGKDYLGELTLEEVYEDLPQIRKKAGDRGALRAIHFVEENRRAILESNALKKKDMNEFLRLVKSSGDSSYKYLQNVYTNHDVEHQNVSVALALSEHLLGESGVSRVHGGGFAGTIQAFVPLSMKENYKQEMERVFGPGTCTVLFIRKYGGTKVI